VSFLMESLTVLNFVTDFPAKVFRCYTHTRTHFLGAVIHLSIEMSPWASDWTETDQTITKCFAASKLTVVSLGARSSSSLNRNGPIR
jgi:hypothetical protein